MLSSARTASEGCVPQTELPVSCSVAVPVGQRHHPALEPRALGDEGGERRGRHCLGDAARIRGSRVRSWAAVNCTSRDGEVDGLVRRKTLTLIGETLSLVSTGKLAFPTNNP
jgi:hypothetical protein